jgi:hypothetical protein
MANHPYRPWNLRAPVFAAGQPDVIPLSDIPNGRVTGIKLSVIADFTHAGGTGVLRAGNQLFRLFSSIILDPYVRVTGRGLYFLHWHMNGITTPTPADIPAADGVYSRNISVWIPFCDKYSLEPLDNALDSSLLRDKALQITWAGAGLWATTAITNATCRAIVYLAPSKQTEIGSPAYIDYVPWGSQEYIAPGFAGYTHVLQYCEEDDVNTDAEYATWSAWADGEQLLMNHRSMDLVEHFDDLMATSGAVYASGIAGGLLNAQPGPAAAAGQVMTWPFIPVISPPWGTGGYQLTHIPIAQDALRIQWTGTQTSARFLKRFVKPVTQADGADAARRLRLPNPTSRRMLVKVAGAGMLSAPAMEILPKELAQSDEEVRARGGVA